MQSSPIGIPVIHRYNQGDRGTYMACAVCSLLGYYFHCHGNDVRLSLQHHSAMCKNEDQWAVSGTYLETAFEMAKSQGICTENDWPYNPSETPEWWKKDTRVSAEMDLDELEKLKILTEMQIDPNRLSELVPVTIDCKKVPFHFLYNNPPSMSECKHTLDGIDGYRTMPVVIGCTVFRDFTGDFHHDEIHA